MTPSLLLGIVSPSAPVTTLALIGAEVVGVPLIVQTIVPPDGKDSTGEVGLHVLVKPGGKSVTVQNAFAAGMLLALEHVIVCPTGYGTPSTGFGRTILGNTCISGLKTGVLTVPVQCAAAGQVGSPPPEAVTVFTAVVPKAAAPTVTGTLISMLPFGTLVATMQLFKFDAPDAGQPLKDPPIIVIGPLVVIPAGKVSAIVIAAVVGPLVTAIRIV